MVEDFLLKNRKASAGEPIEINFWAIIFVLIIAVGIMGLYFIGKKMLPSLVETVSDIASKSAGNFVALIL